MRVIKKITPVFNKIVTTCNKLKLERNKSGILLTTNLGATEGEVDQVQTIISVGPMAEKSGFKPGQVVLINPARYAKIRHVATKNIDGKLGDNLNRDFEYPIFDIKEDNKPAEQVLLISDNDIHCIVECDEYSGNLTDINGSAIKL